MIRTDRPVSDQEWPKLGDDALSALDQLFKHWDERASFEKLAESYLKGKLRVHIHACILGLSVKRGEAVEFCAVFP